MKAIAWGELACLLCYVVSMPIGWGLGITAAATIAGMVNS